MNIAEDYNAWAVSYDAVVNKTRDLEARALREMLGSFSFQNILEAGCGTGKNTPFLIERGEKILSVDFSHEMLQQARQKITSSKVEFKQLDLTQRWPFQSGNFDLVSFSLVLEHIQDLRTTFQQAYEVLRTGGRLYIGELHPFKQYAGSKARFETAPGETRVLQCFTHHTSEYFKAATQAGFVCEQLQEWFDADIQATPRVLTIVFRKV